MDDQSLRKHRVVISSTSSFIAPRINSGMLDAGSARTRAMASTPVREPCGMIRPNSRQKPRSALMRLVRVDIHSERVRCMPCRACYSTDLIRTGTMSEARSASSRTAASAASVLLRLT